MEIKERIKAIATREICINELDTPKAAHNFKKKLSKWKKCGYTNFSVKFGEIKAIFPDAIVPIVGIIDFFSQKGLNFKYENESAIIRKLGAIEPCSFRKDESSRNILKRVWKFSNSTDVSILIDAYINELVKVDRYPKGFLTSIEWSLNEVMDNVIQHSQADCGYVMGQLHVSQHYIAFTIFDQGQGIYNSLKDSEHSPRNSVDAITLAIQESVTRDSGIGQGNGLFGLYTIVQNGNGLLAISSGDASYVYNKGIVSTFKALPCLSDETPGTIIDFRINYLSEFSWEKVLMFKGKPYHLINLRVQNFENELGFVHYKLRDHAEGTGTRESAIRVKNEIIELIQESQKKVIIDFEGIAVISSSFSDELIAKLLWELGLFQFNNLIALRGMDGSQQNILHRSVIQRLVEEYNKI